MKILSLSLSISPTAPDVCFQPFVFKGFVSLNDDVESWKTVKILRDTEGSQSFILSDTLDFLCGPGM